MKQLILLLLFSTFFTSCEEQADHEIFYQEKINLGDHEDWADPTYDDTHWPSYIETRNKVVFWERTTIKIPDNPDFYNHNVIMIGALANYDAYFDGVYLGNNTGLEQGQQSSKAGKYQTYFLIPDSLNTTGTHLVAMRYHRVENNLNFWSYIIVGNFISMLRMPLQVSKLMFLFAGIYLIVGLFYLLMFAYNSKEGSVLIFGLVCILYFTLLILEYLKFFYDYPYPFQQTRLIIIAWLNMAVAILIPWFFCLLFSFPWKKLLIGLLTICTLGIYAFNDLIDLDELAKLHNSVLWFFSFIVVAYAFYKKQRYAPLVTSGLIVGSAIIMCLPKFYHPYVSAFDISLFASFAVLIITMLIATSLKRRDDQKAYEASILQSEKLKTELLKKNIRPHFILNTLTSMMDWVEESPQEGVKFIGALAQEFEILNEIADHKLVPIRQEIKLCKSHLKVMGYRKEVKYLWEDHNIDDNEIIPPATLHTIIENGITHSMPNERGEVKFKLSFENTKTLKAYKIQTFAINRKKSKPTKEGTGTKYIKSRLTESYGNNWRFVSEEKDYGWASIIEILK